MCLVGFRGSLRSHLNHRSPGGGAVSDTIPGVLRAAAERFGDHPAYVEAGDGQRRTVSYAELLRLVQRTSAEYAEACVGRRSEESREGKERGSRVDTGGRRLLKKNNR